MAEYHQEESNGVLSSLECTGSIATDGSCNIKASERPELCLGLVAAGSVLGFVSARVCLSLAIGCLPFQGNLLSPPWIFFTEGDN